MDLQEALDFTQTDLEANQTGKLSSAQRNTLRQRQARSWQVLRNLTTAIILMAIGAVVFGGMVSIMLGTTAFILSVMGIAEIGRASCRERV